MKAAAAGVLVFLLAANAATVAIHAAMMPYRTGGGMFLGWLLCIAAFAVTAAVVSKRTGQGGGLFLPFLLFCIFSCLYGVVGGRLPRLWSLRETPVLTVKEADRPPHAASHVFHFSDGHIDRRYHNFAIHRTKVGRTSSHVAPIVPEGWQESDPITLWAVGERNDGSSFMPWSRDARGGYTPASVAEYEQLIRDEISRHSLVSSPTAPMILLSDDPRPSLLAAARMELWALLAVNVLSMGGLLLPFVRRKPAAA
jgi:hypothetical protein